jgi:inosine/xanthosine triphosphatase
VDSGVGVQPYGFEQTLIGAKNRAKQAFFNEFKKPYKSTFLGVGIEAGMIPVPHTNTGYLDYQFCAIYLPNGQFTYGSGPGFEYPSSIVDLLLNNPHYSEIGTIIENKSSIPDVKQKEGAIGYLSNYHLNRAEILQFSVIMALLSLKNPRVYE